jgi:hypothetical protein
MAWFVRRFVMVAKNELHEVKGGGGESEGEVIFE